MKQVIPTICQTGCLLGLEPNKWYSASNAAATVFDPKLFPIPYERLRKKLYYFSTSRPISKDDLPSNPDNAFRDAQGKPVLILNAKKQLCVALLPDEIYPRWLGSTWQRYVTEEEKEEYRRTYLELRQGFLVVIALFLSIFFRNIYNYVQTSRENALNHPKREEKQIAQPQKYFYGWKEKFFIPAILCLFMFGFIGLFKKPTITVKEQMPTIVAEQSLGFKERIDYFKRQKMPAPKMWEFCSKNPHIERFVSVSHFSIADAGFRVPQNLNDTPP